MGFSIRWTYCSANKFCNDTDWIVDNPQTAILPFIRAASILSGMIEGNLVIVSET